MPAPSDVEGLQPDTPMDGTYESEDDGVQFEEEDEVAEPAEMEDQDGAAVDEPAGSEDAAPAEAPAAAAADQSPQVWSDNTLLSNQLKWGWIRHGHTREHGLFAQHCRRISATHPKASQGVYNTGGVHALCSSHH